MGTVALGIFALFIGLLFLLGWVSLNAVCDCVPLTEQVAGGTLGLFFVSGAFLGLIGDIFFG